MPDRYSYPNSLVLINKLGITDYDRWKAVETAAIHQRMVELTEHPTPGRYDLPHLRAIHRHLTHDLYVWGGDIRDTDTHPGGTGIAHCRPPFIVPEADASSANSPPATTSAAWTRTDSPMGWRGCGVRRPRSIRSAT